MQAGAVSDLPSETFHCGLLLLCERHVCRATVFISHVNDTYGQLRKGLSGTALPMLLVPVSTLLCNSRSHRSSVGFGGRDFIGDNFHFTIVVNIVTAQGKESFGLLRNTVFLSGRLSGISRTGGGRLPFQCSIKQEGALSSAA